MSKTVLVVADMHIPFVHPQYHRFIRDMLDKHSPDEVVFSGDIVDWHSISYHEADPNGMSPGDELQASRKALRAWVKSIPKARVCIGNHDALLHRKMLTHGLPASALRAYKEIFDTPKWDWQEEHVLDAVLYTHGTGLSGQNSAMNKAIRGRISTVIGHTHSFGGCQYHASARDLIFGLNVGCGIDIRAYSFAYSKPFVNRPVLGCGLVKSQEEAYFIPMDAGGRYKRRKT